MLCPSCHTDNRDNAKFCKVCGYSFTSTNQAGTDVTNTARTVANAAIPASVTSIDPTNTAASPQAQDTFQPAVSNGTIAGNGQQAMNDQAVEVVVQEVAPSASTSPATPHIPDATPADVTPTNVDNEATQVLSHEEMLALQARRQRPLTDEQQESQSVNGNTNAAPETPLPLSVNQTPEGDVVVGEPPEDVLPQFPTDTQQANTPNTPNIPNTPIPPPPPAESVVEQAVTTSPYAQEAAAPPVSVTPVTLVSSAKPAEDSEILDAQDVSSTESDEESQASIEGDVQPSPTDASVLQIGSVVGGRYEVTDVLDADDQDAQPIGRTYHVVDRQGYQRCWNCGSEQNAEGDEFCIECGAELLNAPYIMHEYPGNEQGNGSSQTSEAHVLQGNIMNTFVEHGRTYVVEQPQEAQVAFPNGVHLLFAGDSDAGNVRRSEPNEDSILVMQLQRIHESHTSPSGVFIIADGMGGHANGQGASRLIINGIAQRILSNLFLPPLNAEQAGQEVKPLEESDLIATFKDAVQESNNELCQLNQRDKSDAGSTLTGFMIVDEHAYIINVGDSRTYMLREGTLYQLTTDHSLVGQLVASGLIEPDDVYTHPQRSQIFRSLGDKTNVQIDDFKQQLLPGDILLSCSDGLWEMVRNPQITDILNNAHDPQTACTQLIEAANTNGGEDNVSSIVVFVR